MGIYSKIEWMPKNNNKVDTICFPYYFESELINIKYRAGGKDFKLHKEAELILYDIDCIKKYESVIICEGEIDALSLIEIGFENVVSVPNGAGGSTDYLDDYIYLFDNKKVILAVDNDMKGLHLRNELIKKLGVDNCYVVNFGEYKDANEVLTDKGSFELRRIIDDNEPAINYDKGNPYSLFLNSILDPTMDVLPPSNVCTILDRVKGKVKQVRFQTLGNISMLQGKAKAGKTYLLSMILPAIICKKNYEKFVGHWANFEKNEVFYFDTEQADYDGMQVLKRISKFTNGSKNFMYSCLREFDPSQRLAIIENALKKHSDRVCYVVIDGIADLMYSLNDEKEAVILSSHLMRWSKDYNCHICVILHENKNKENKNAQGWIGTILNKKCETIFAVEGDVNDNLKNVTSVFQRGTKPFNPFTYEIDFKTGIATCTDVPKEQEYTKQYNIVDYSEPTFGDEPPF